MLVMNLGLLECYLTTTIKIIIIVTLMDQTQCCSHINNNIKLSQSFLHFTAIFFTLLLATQAKPAQHSTQVHDLSVLVLHHQDQSYHLPLTINHHALKLKAELQSGRTWIKEGLCKFCELEEDQCKTSCFTDKESPKISCDSSFCSEVGEYNDETRGVAGKEGDVFLKIGDSSQVLMPLILADKLYQPHEEMGEFHIFDADSSFSNAIFTKSSQGSLQLRNMNKMQAGELQKVRQKEGKPLDISMNGEQFDFSFLKNKKVTLHHVSDDEKYSNFTDDNEYAVAFSLQAMAVSLPLKLARKLERHLSETYLLGKKCKLLPKKLKCTGEAEMQEIFRTVLHFQLNGYQLPIPLHLLITGCSSNECSTLINFDESPQDTITFGYVIWELYNLQYNLDNKHAIFHRKTTQFDDLFLLDRVSPSSMSFMYRLLLIVYHTLKYVFIILFWLALFSLVVNLVMRWRSILSWFRAILLIRKQKQVAHSEEEPFEEKPLRKINKLHDPLEDSESI